MAKVGDIKRFERPNQLLAFAGLDTSVHQSGDLQEPKTDFLSVVLPTLEEPFGKLLLSLHLKILPFPCIIKN
ncbi:hypothetical protein D358_00242 [Enterococcus faecalis RP2S-4]|uniref:Transposase IS116/IS110/IS902 C-terminal domain-containing protein n=1 Tax=Enterococcus faecalis RP2S-4 TaxID=1244145 RepID=A0ABC9TPI2_ENTFL|nr:hypothetical protein D358_00242 [Enterococcus faecalis RP2S-4]